MTQNYDLEQRILQAVRQAGYRPVKPRGIAQQLNLSKAYEAEVRRAVKRLVHQGQLAYGANHLVMPPAASSDASANSTRQSRQTRMSAPLKQDSSAILKQDSSASERQESDVSTTKTTRSSKAAKTLGGRRKLGVFQRTQKGFGFVRLEKAEGATETPKDIFIPADRCRDAATGDVVMVEVGRSRHGDPGPRGEIVEVVERQTHEFVGTYFESAGAAFVKIDGTLFARPIRVGDPGAKNARPDDKVVVEMLRFPSAMHDGEGVIAEVLGPRGKPGVDTLSIIREFNLPDHFAEDALEEARLMAEKFEEVQEKGTVPRTDFTNDTIVTIDPVDARDFDDAISLERLPDGKWRLGVHIADVSHFVRPKTALDREAYERGTSVYLPDRVLPMLPEVISNGLASLQPGVVRYTKTAIMEFTAEGKRISTELHSGAIKSTKRLTYEQVDEFLAARRGGQDARGTEEVVGKTSSIGEDLSRQPPPSPLPDAMKRKLGGKICDLLGRMHELAMMMRKRRMAQGALELNMPEVKVDLDENGQVTGAHVVENTESHQIIEEFMLEANEAVAERLRDRGLFFLRRVHQSPSPQKLQALTEFAAELGYKTESLQSRFELQKLLAAATGRPEQHAVHFAVLRSMQRAIYTPMEEGHYALASECYCHFTSPIRRYPDLTIHRLVDAILTKTKPRGKGDRPHLPERPEGCFAQMGPVPFSAKPRNNYDEMVVVARQCSEREQRAEAAERDLTKLKLLAYLSNRIGEEMDAVVTGVESYGIFVQGVELPAEGLVRVETLRDDTYRFDRASHTLAGYREGNSYRLGDLLRVAVSKVDLERREIDFRVVERGKQRPAPSAKGAKVTKKMKKMEMPKKGKKEKKGARKKRRK